MIGDTIDKDVLGPNKYGIDSIYYNPEGKEYDKKKIISIDNFNEIKSYINAKQQRKNFSTNFLKFHK